MNFKEDKLKLGIIGCGEISVATAKAVNNSENMELAMCMDIRKDVAQSLGSKFNIPVTTDTEELLDKEEIDVVYIAVPHDLHPKLAIQTAEHNKHVMLEKPIATNLEGADRIISSCRKNGVKLGICCPQRYEPTVQKARELIQKGVIGEITGIHIPFIVQKDESYWSGGYSGRVKTNWRTSKKRAGGGVLMMNIIHNIDFLRYITGLEIEHVYGEYDTKTTAVEVEDIAVATLKYSNGALGSIIAGSDLKGGSGPNSTKQRIFGKKGQITLNWEIDFYTEKDNTGYIPGEWHNMNLQRDKGSITTFVEKFARAIKKNKESPITGEDGRKALEVVLGIYRSCDEGQIINLPLN
ncbi:MAG: Gfo/Idh/MocA family protein [Bacillota bacterium]